MYQSIKIEDFIPFVSKHEGTIHITIEDFRNDNYKIVHISYEFDLDSDIHICSDKIEMKDFTSVEDFCPGTLLEKLLLNFSDRLNIGYLSPC